MMKWLKQMLLLNAVLLPPMLLFPALCLLPIFAAHPDPGWAQACFWFGPLSAAFWTLVYSQWSSARVWQRMGRLHEWRRDHGGLLVTVTKATAWMFLGLFGSFLCEVAFMIAFRRVPPAMFDSTARLRLWFALFPLACYFPLFAAWAWRRLHG
jgi:hypothetical protein